MKLEVGMYVRTKNDKAVGNGIIGKIKYINEREFKGKLKKYYSVWTNNKEWFEILENDAISERVKASHNIIDLLQVGDIITFKEDEDVYKILQIPSKEWDFEDFYLVKNYDGETEDILVEYDEMKKYINSIVTKEQFESMSYKVGD